MDFVRELGAFMLERKKFWLLPIMCVFGMFGGLIVLTQGSAIARFIYTLWSRICTLGWVSRPPRGARRS
jgi:hypothetical protein